MKKTTFIFLLFSLLFLSSYSQNNVANDICKQIFMFGNNATFPNQQNISKYKIAVFGKNSEVYNVLIQNYSSSKIHSKPVEIKNINKVSELSENFNIVFVDYSKNKNLEEIYNQIHGKGVLLITYKATDAEFIMVNLSENNSYQIQSLNLIDENISLPENIMATGGNKYDLLELYEQKVKLLSERENDLIKKENQLDSLSNIVNNQKIENEKKEELLKQQSIDLTEKQKILEDQQKAINIQAFTIKIQKNIILIAVIFVLIFVTLSYIIFRALKKNRIITEKLRQSNEEIRQQNEYIEIQANEIKIQRDLAVERGNELEHKNKDIQDSIRYALKIQQALLPNVSFLEKHYSEFYIFYKPRDIVSGDFYWATEKNNKIIVVAADCTGHGVPGAMMSMLGISLLNQIFDNIDNIDDFDTKTILDKLSDMIIKSLKQNIDAKDSTQDGMDLAITIYDKNTGIIVNSGAYNPLYIVAEKQPEVISDFTDFRVYENEKSKSKLFELTAEKRPIGVYIGEKEFKTHRIKVSKNDKIFMFSDGFSDMYSYKRNSKYSSKRFKEFLVTNSALPMKQQREKIEQEYNQWLDGDHQIDDILVVGLKI